MNYFLIFSLLKLSFILQLRCLITRLIRSHLKLVEGSPITKKTKENKGKYQNTQLMEGNYEFLFKHQTGNESPFYVKYIKLCIHFHIISCLVTWIILLGINDAIFIAKSLNLLHRYEQWNVDVKRVHRISVILLSLLQKWHGSNNS